MWSLVINDANQVVQLSEIDDHTEVGSPYPVYILATRRAALAKIAELGATYADPKVAEADDLSKLVLRRRLRKVGLEEAFNAALEANPQAKADWADAQVISTSDPLVRMMLPQLQTALHLSDQVIDKLLRPEDP